jgi:hypothetical protein
MVRVLKKVALMVDRYGRRIGGWDGGMVYWSCSWSRKSIRNRRCHGKLFIPYESIADDQMVFIGPFLFLRINSPPQLQGFFVMIPVTIVVCPHPRCRVWLMSSS